MMLELLLQVVLPIFDSHFRQWLSHLLEGRLSITEYSMFTVFAFFYLQLATCYVAYMLYKIVAPDSQWSSLYVGFSTTALAASSIKA
jgi:hypothetical protein